MEETINNVNEEYEDIYSNITRKKTILVLSFLVITFMVFILDVVTGPAMLSISEVIKSIFSFNSSSTVNGVIIWTIRLPMALMAIAVGATLGIAGGEMQTILDNPLASPYTLGISASASFGAALAIVLGLGTSFLGGEGAISLNAFIFSLVACCFIYFLGKYKSMSTTNMVLSGIAILFLFRSLLALLEYIGSETDAQTIMFWMFGSLMKSTWIKVQIVYIVLLFAIIILIKDAWKLTALRLGDEKAKSLGVNVQKLKLRVFVLVSFLTSVAVCFVGTIGFIGLVGPHIARMLVGEDQRFFMPMAAISGALLLSAASVMSKIIIPGVIFPIGIVTSMIGVPFFLALIIRKRRG
ncbi:iron ABC transporter permease [Clostridium botulinum]|nr:iron ABC transporter permease [Clostridium botulinum]